MFCGASRGVHNWHIPLIWTEPRVHLLQFAILLGRSLILGVPFHVQAAIGTAIGRWLKRRYPDKLVLGSIVEIRDALWRTAATLPVPPAALRSSDASEYTIAYFHLMTHRPAPPVRLPANMTAPIRAALAAAVGGGSGARKLCCLYLRQRGSASEVDSFVRTGSELSDYVPAIRRLVQAGYQCLLVGDRKLSGEVAQMFGGWLADAQSLGQDPAATALFGASEADLFIGESGGGTFLPGVNGIPTLIVNNIPYYQTRYRATTFFKLCTDDSGALIDLKRMFGELSRAHEIQGGTIHSNTPDQLELAVIEFLAEHRKGEAYGVAVETVVGRPNDLWYADAQARISPAWLGLVSGAKRTEPTRATLAGR
jgi:putative glycosyltransferase (TIGR04372 family)